MLSIKRIVLAGVLSVILLASGEAWAEPVKVFVSIPPQKYFVEKIGGDQVDVSIMVEPGANPHNYEPKPRQMADLSKAAVYFAVGVTFEDVWLKKIAAANPDMVIVHTDQGIKKIPMAAHHHHDEEGHEGHHEDHDKSAQGHEEEGHGIPDPHVWTSPTEVRVLAKNILEGLVRVDPGRRTSYEAGYNEFVAELDRLDADLKEIFAGHQGLKFMVFHPAWGYLAKAYGLEQIPVELEGKSPKPAQLKEIIEEAREEGVKVVFVQPQMSTKSAEVIAREIGGRVVFADPLAEDWGRNLKEQAEKFKEALK